MYYEKGKLHQPSLGAQIEDELMKYIVNEPIAIGEKIPT